MRVVILTGSGPAHCYVANRLASAHPIEATFVIETRRTKSSAARRLIKRYSWRQLGSRALAKALAAAARENQVRDREIRDVLGSDSDGIRDTGTLHRVSTLNTDDTYAQVAALEPDAILVYGTGIVGRRLLALPKRIVLNMHTGISPHYRGHACAFWPLFNNELHRLGATVHECTPEVDGGMIFSTGRATLQATDGVFSAFARCVEVGTELYIKAVADLRSGTLQGEAQDLSIGREYRAVQKGWYSEWVVRRKVRRGLIRDYVEGQRPN